MPAGAKEKVSDNACDQRQAKKPHVRLRRTKSRFADPPERRSTEPHGHDSPFTSPGASVAAVGMMAAQGCPNTMPRGAEISAYSVKGGFA